MFAILELKMQPVDHLKAFISSLKISLSVLSIYNIIIYKYILLSKSFNLSQIFLPIIIFISVSINYGQIPIAKNVDIKIKLKKNSHVAGKNLSYP